MCRVYYLVNLGISLTQKVPSAIISEGSLELANLFLVVNDRVTLRDIAEKTGLHFTTVGLALRNDPRISATTRKRVTSTAKALGYHRDPFLSALASCRAKSSSSYHATIAFLQTHPIDKEIDPRPRVFFDSAERHAANLGFKLEKISLYGTGLSSRRVDGILKSRGVSSVILSPVQPGYEDYPELNWEALCVVAAGYSISTVNPHRVAPHQTKSMQTQCRELRKLGYKRIGLILPEHVHRRTFGHFLGAYLSDQQFQQEEFKVSPFIPSSDDFRINDLAAWIQKNKPDSIIVPGKSAYEKILECGLRVPEDLGISVLSIEDPGSEIAGIDEQVGVSGELAIDLLISLLCSNQRGIPQYPRYSLVEGRWVWNSTLRHPSKHPTYCSVQQF